MTTPNPSPEVCHYGGLDSQAVVRTNDDGTWMSRCNCLTVTCASGTYDEAVAALEAHREENT